MNREWWKHVGPDGRTFAQRLRGLREARGLDQSDVYTGEAKPRTEANNMSRWEQGDSAPESRYLLALARFFDVSVHWLATGEGPRQPDANQLDEAEAIVEEALAKVRALKGRPNAPAPGEVVDVGRNGEGDTEDTDGTGTEGG